MLTVIRNGDILQSRCPALVNPVNCVGVMGKGLAKQFRNRYPDMDRQYRQDCNSRLLQPGTIRAYPVSPNRTVICLPTKRHWREPSRLQDIAAGLDALGDWITDNPVPGIAIPPLGAGLGGLRWNVVRPLIIRFADRFPESTTELYEPYDCRGD